MCSSLYEFWQKYFSVIFWHNAFNWLKIPKQCAWIILPGPSSCICKFPAVTVVPLWQHSWVSVDSSLTFRHYIQRLYVSWLPPVSTTSHQRDATEDVAKTLAASLIHSRIDYTNCLIQGSTTSRDCSLYRTQLPWGGTEGLTSSSWWSSLWITLALCSVQNILQYSLSHLQNTFHQSAYLYATLGPSLHTTVLYAQSRVNQLLLEQPLISIEFVKRSCSHLAPKTWTSFPLKIRLAPTLEN